MHRAFDAASDAAVSIVHTVEVKSNTTLFPNKAANKAAVFAADALLATPE